VTPAGDDPDGALLDESDAAVEPAVGVPAEIDASDVYGSEDQGSELYASEIYGTEDGADGGPGAVSGDRHWRWDGERWERNEQLGAWGEPAPGLDPPVRDGNWQWDGTGWQPVA
jgi:hypothetical protein